VHTSDAAGLPAGRVGAMHHHALVIASERRGC